MLRAAENALDLSLTKRRDIRLESGPASLLGKSQNSCNILISFWTFSTWGECVNRAPLLPPSSPSPPSTPQTRHKQTICRGGGGGRVAPLFSGLHCLFAPRCVCLRLLRNRSQNRFASVSRLISASNYFCIRRWQHVFSPLAGVIVVGGYVLERRSPAGSSANLLSPLYVCISYHGPERRKWESDEWDFQDDLKVV